MYKPLYSGGRNGLVAISTRYGLDGPGIGSRWGVKFSVPLHIGSEDPPSRMYNGYRFFSGRKVAGAWYWPPTPLWRRSCEWLRAMTPPPLSVCTRMSCGDLYLYIRTVYTRLLPVQASYTCTYLLTYLLTPWSRVLEKLTGSAPSQEIPCIFGTRRFITVLTGARHLSLSSANSRKYVVPYIIHFLL